MIIRVVDGRELTGTANSNILDIGRLEIESERDDDDDDEYVVLLLLL